MRLTEDDVLLGVTYVLNKTDVSVVELTLLMNGVSPNGEGGLVIGTGVSRRDPKDAPNPAIGLDLAMARALTDLAKKANRRVAGKIKHTDDVNDMNLDRAVKEAVKKIEAKAEVVKVAKPKKAKKKTV
jgi:hypothetical protein